MPAQSADTAAQTSTSSGGDAAIAFLQVDQATGTIEISVGGSIIDNRTNEDANVTAHTLIVTAGENIGGSTAADLDTSIAVLSGASTSGDIRIDERDDIQLGDTFLDAQNNIQLRNLIAPGGSISIDAGGIIDILNGTYLQSSTGKVSNAPPPIPMIISPEPLTPKPRMNPVGIRSFK